MNDGAFDALTRRAARHLDRRALIAVGTGALLSTLPVSPARATPGGGKGPNCTTRTKPVQTEVGVKNFAELVEKVRNAASQECQDAFPADFLTALECDDAYQKCISEEVVPFAETACKDEDLLAKAQQCANRIRNQYATDCVVCAFIKRLNIRLDQYLDNKEYRQRERQKRLADCRLWCASPALLLSSEQVKACQRSCAKDLPKA